MGRIAKCLKCGEEKNIFCKGMCRVCQYKEYYRTNKERTKIYSRAYSAEYRKKNPEYNKKYSIRYSKEHPDRLKEQRKKYRATHPEMCRQGDLHKTFHVRFPYVDARILEQGGVDPITFEPVDRMHSSQDHDHFNGLPRGILEQGNRILCGCDKNPDKFKFLKEYLKNNPFMDVSKIDDNLVNNFIKNFYPDKEKRSYVQDSLKKRGGSLILKVKMWLSGNKKCHACGCDLSIWSNNTCFDHHHALNKPRGILCRSCNQSLIAGFETPEVLDRAIAYLEEWKERHKYFTKDERGDWVAPPKKQVI